MKTRPTWMKKGVRFLVPAYKLTPTCGPILGSVFRPPFLGPAATSGSKFLAPRHAFLSTLSVSNWHVETLLFIAAKGSILWGAMCLTVAWYFCCKRQNFRLKDLHLTPNFSRHLVFATCLGPSSWRLVLASHPDPCPDISHCHLFVALSSWHLISLPDGATTRRPHSLTS